MCVHIYLRYSCRHAGAVPIQYFVTCWVKERHADCVRSLERQAMSRCKGCRETWGRDMKVRVSRASELLTEAQDAVAKFPENRHVVRNHKFRARQLDETMTELRKERRSMMGCLSVDRRMIADLKSDSVLAVLEVASGEEREARGRFDGNLEEPEFSEEEWFAEEFDASASDANIYKEEGEINDGDEDETGGETREQDR